MAIFQHEVPRCHQRFPAATESSVGAWSSLLTRFHISWPPTSGQFESNRGSIKHLRNGNGLDLFGASRESPRRQQWSQLRCRRYGSVAWPEDCEDTLSGQARVRIQNNSHSRRHAGHGRFVCRKWRSKNEPSGTPIFVGKEVRRRALGLFEQCGRTTGKDIDDLLNVERECRRKKMLTPVNKEASYEEIQ